MIPAKLAADAEKLRKQGYNVKLVQEGPFVHVVFDDFLLGPRYHPPKSSLLTTTTFQYPLAGFDMFWVDPVVELQGGATPKAAEIVNEILGRNWRRFSWHLNTRWNPKRDSLLSWVAAIEHRLQQGV